MTGCISSKSYVDPSFGKATYDDIQKVETQHAMLVDIEFQRNGEAFPDANAKVRSHVERTLCASGVITLVFDGTRAPFENAEPMSPASAFGVTV